MTIYTTQGTATQASLGRLRELVLVWVLVDARALLHLLLAFPLLVAVPPSTAARCCSASCSISAVVYVTAVKRQPIVFVVLQQRSTVLTTRYSSSLRSEKPTRIL